MSNRLQDKVALITGGTNGIGKAAVQGMTREGARVVFTGNNVEAGNQIASDTGATFIQHAVQDVQGWEVVKAAIREQHGRLDVTFSNAGTYAGDSDIETVEVDAWKNLVDINLTGMMLAIKASIELMKANPDGSGGSIILNSSINGMLALAGDVTYSTTKGALRLLAKSTAVHLAKTKTGIRCNSIHPGVIETPLIQALLMARLIPLPQEACWRHCPHGPAGQHGRNRVAGDLPRLRRGEICDRFRDRDRWGLYRRAAGRLRRPIKSTRRATP